MASSYKHGVYVGEQETSLIAPVEGTAGLQVIFGTAPVNMLEDPAAAVNKPQLVYSYAEAVAASSTIPCVRASAPILPLSTQVRLSWSMCWTRPSTAATSPR